ncbi:MAG: DUF2065 domain-containing protein [Gammaproteobacteria bacterium]
MWHELLVAAALVLVIEGIMPFLSPEGWRRMLQRVMRASDQTLRFAGLSCMTLGCLLLYVINRY